MAVDLDDPESREVFERGKEILGVDLRPILRDGPQEELNSTRISQPAIFLHSMAVLRVLAKLWNVPRPFCQGVPAFATAGLSLGEYSALVFAGSLDFEDALGIVKLRGEYMQEACIATKGTMASVLGLLAEAVEKVVGECRAAGCRVGVANYNSPDQTVISGTVEAVADATARLVEAGARRVIPLKVAGAFHSPLMASATEKLAPFLRKIPIEEPEVPFYSNVTGARVEDPEAIRQGLIDQLESPVRWKQIMGALVEGGLKCAYEIGPGRVLQGLLRNIEKGVEVISAGTKVDLEKLKDLSPQLSRGELRDPEKILR